ncbi:thioredoxin reductase [Virgisporangium aliadipatigenens]|uniref:Thioredoxin reductase n=1 Tax=Virgisporangium aliadipatigenens TaxID=741659 RepID=A0A8J3YFT9_9ACTN|nr:FAD-dependent oxidoreductase [Virgisporangium aliadipatigenens]GIJ44236.1 thioredoxin reductase [Virgisporangium aliadipatigenens]
MTDSRTSEAPAAYDVAIVGMGAAGLAAAAVLGRSGRSVAVVGTRDRGNAGATEVHNLPYAEGIAPEDLYGRMERELDRYGTSVFPETVEKLSAPADGAGPVTVETGSRVLVASRLLLANGVENVPPPWVPQDTWGTTVFDCPFCHAYEHRGEDFAVVGPRQMTVQVALLCVAHARSLVVVVADAEAVGSSAAERVRELGGEVLHGEIVAAERHPSGQLTLVTSGGRDLAVGAVLVSGATRMRRQFVDQLDVRVNRFGIPELDADGKSSNPLVWIAGTAAAPNYVLVEAMGSGIRSAMALHKDLAFEGLH